MENHQEAYGEMYSSPITASSATNSVDIGSRYADFTPKRLSSPKGGKAKKRNDDADDISLWSPAKRNAYAAREKNPNAFYYRHVEPGQVKRTGAWDEHEKAMFMKAIELHPPSQGKWGIFARHIPGRVGYQCRNFYHRLLESGELKEIPGSDDTVAVQKKTKSPKTKSPSVKTQTVRVVEASEKEESEDQEEVEVPPTPPPVKPKIEYDIDSLQLFSSAFDYKSFVSATEEPQIEQEITIPEEPKTEELLEPSDVPSSPIVVNSEASKPVWSRRMDRPWELVNKAQLVFPSDPLSTLECSLILSNQVETPLNLILLTIPVPEGKRDVYRRSIRRALSSSKSQSSFNEMIKEYFRIKKLCSTSQVNQIDLLDSFADMVIEKCNEI